MSSPSIFLRKKFQESIPRKFSELITYLLTYLRKKFPALVHPSIHPRTNSFLVVVVVVVVERWFS